MTSRTELYIGMTVTRKAKNYGPSKGSDSSELIDQSRGEGTAIVPVLMNNELLIQALWCEKGSLGNSPLPFPVTAAIKCASWEPPAQCWR